MKKSPIIILLFAILAIFALAACEKDKPHPAPPVVNQTPVEPGMIIYGDATYSFDDLRYKGKVPIGIAVNTRLMISHQSSPTPLAWGPAGKIEGLPAFERFPDAAFADSGTGAANSLIIANHARANAGKVYPANDYALSYTPVGAYYRAFFLPNVSELDDVFRMRRQINVSLVRLDRPSLEGTYWASVHAIDAATPDNITKAWQYNMTPLGGNDPVVTTGTLQVLLMAPIPAAPVPTSPL